MKKIFFSFLTLGFLFCLGGINVYADTTTYSSNIISSETTSKKEVEIGESNFNIIVENNDCWTGLNQLLELELPEDFGTEKRLLLATDLKSFLVEVMSNGGYTLETFKSKFIEILIIYGLDVPEEFVQAIEQYGAYYFNDDFEQEDNEQLLVWIGGTLGMMTTLFLTSQQGGVHRGY